ncbi:hypothetical protein BGZ63DRAFT_388556 [Mariannaea sp. PMI_226]|nr:hypothetical protein BGZ63DRAFT_388556 [Mariannaea sp. PMI_226]
MEALAAIGLASNVVQFVQFVSGLVSTANEIHDSIDGTSRRSNELEKIYDHLSAFSRGLRGEGSSGPSNGGGPLRNLAFGQPDPTLEVSLQSHIRSVEDLAADCNALCGELLETVRDLRVNGARYGPFKSFMAALKTAWKRKKIESLEKRLDGFRSMILLHLFPFLSHQQSFMLHALTSLRDEGFKLRADQAAKLDDLAAGLRELKNNLEMPTYRRDGKQPSDDSSAGYLIRQMEVAKLNSSDMEQLESDISNLVLTEQSLTLIAKEQAFLRSLDFVSRPRRHDDLQTAHTKTFEWVLEEPGDAQPDGNRGPSLLSTWLRYGDGIFWVSGKAGSGKSTLMKWTADHDKTQKALEKWASPKKHVIAAHYFWSGGLKIQKSQKGLIQTLLYDIFRMSPELIPEIYPRRWSKTSLLDSENSKEWTMHELLDALRQIANHCDVRAKYCVFIDGIDEFEGDHFELCHLLKGLSASPNFKFCLSSRPWNVFEDAFGVDSTRKLYLHDLTRQDILIYIKSWFAQHPRRNESNFSNAQMQGIINTITQRAQGVFLWVFLALKSLRDGLVNGDKFLDLQRRLESLPTDLEDFFKHMLDLVDPFYHKNMARLLRIAVNARQSLNLQFYYMHEYEYEDTDYAINMPVESHTPEGIEAMLVECRRRINARCGGLLEVKDDRVEFLHRTVRDFLLTDEMSNYLSEKGGADFMVNLSTLKGFVFLFKSWMQSTSWLALAEEQPFWSHGLEYANDAIGESKEAAFAHLDAVEDLYLNMPGSRDSDFLDVKPDFVFRCELLKSGVDRYVSEKLNDEPLFFDSVFESPLCTVMNQPQWTTGHVRVITHFLNLGCDVNEDSQSPWYLLVQRACSIDEADVFTIAIENSLFSAFLKHGAKRDIRIQLTANLDEPPLLLDGSHNNGIRLPCAHVIGAIMLHESSYKFSHQCLGTIDDFLNVDPPEVELQLHEIMSAFQVQLLKLSKQKLDLRRVSFISKIIQKVTRKAIDVGLEMDRIIPSVKALFPGRKGSALVDLIRKKQDSGYYFDKSPLKRAPADIPAARVNKRAKSYRVSKVSIRN